MIGMGTTPRQCGQEDDDHSEQRQWSRDGHVCLSLNVRSRVLRDDKKDKSGFRLGATAASGVTAQLISRWSIMCGWQSVPSFRLAGCKLRNTQGIPMTEKPVSLRIRLKQVGFTQGNQMKLYGHEFELLGEPIFGGDNLVFVDAIEKKSGQLRRVRIPLPIVKMATAERSAA